MEITEKRRVVVVGDNHFADDARSTLDLVRKLLDAGCDASMIPLGDVVAVTGHSRMLRDRNIFELFGHPIEHHEPVLTVQSDRTPPHGWYQQFAGRRGRPRY